MPQTGSFIPKQTSNIASAGKRTKKRVYLLNYVSFILLIGTLLTIGGLLAFEFQLDRSLAEQKELLAMERESFSQGDIERVREFEQRLIAAEVVLNQHVASSRILASLEAVTVLPVMYETLTLEKDEGEKYTLMLAGGSNELADLLFQRDVLKTDQLFRRARIEGVALVQETEPDAQSKTDGVSFSVTTELNRSDFAYQAPQAVAPQVGVAPVTGASPSEDEVTDVGLITN